jgi:L-lysine exporter family protein LysE/ArgO
MTLIAPSFAAGLALSLSLIMTIGPQNAHVLRMGLQRKHLFLTTLVCMVSDVLLIALGVTGLAQLGGINPQVQGALMGAGILFLTTYGWRSAQRAWQGQPSNPHVAPTSTTMRRRDAIGAALAFSWLNPHAWLDTAVLIGGASLAYGANGNVFGLGAATGSVLWFASLGVATLWLGQRLNSRHIWRTLDAVVALMMWGTAASLIHSLF